MSSTQTPAPPGAEEERDDVQEDVRHHAPARIERGAPTSKKLLHYLGMPVLIAIVVVALYLWVSGQQLDSVEARVLTLGVTIDRTIQHLRLTLWSTLIVLLIAVPLGIFATRPRTKRFAPIIIGLGNAGQAIPSLGMLALFFFLFFTIPVLPSTGEVPVVAALVAYSFLPILRNTMVGLQQVDESILEAGRGMGMGEGRVLGRIELPLAVPVILAGVRTALVLNVGTATLAFLFGGGGLGQTIFTGFQLRRTPVLVTGAVLAAVLALLVDYLGGLAEERLTPKGL